MTLEKQIIQALRTIRDPEMPVNIYDLGLIYGIDASPEGDVKITMTLTAPNCPVAESLPREVKVKVASVAGVKSVDVRITFDPPWHAGKVEELVKLSLGL